MTEVYVKKIIIERHHFGKVSFDGIKLVDDPKDRLIVDSGD